MAKIANLSADLVANTSSFEADLRRADRALNSSQAQWGRALGKIDKQFGALGRSVKGVAGELFSVKGAFAALIGTIGAESILALAKDAVDAVGGLGEMAAQIGVTTDTLQAFDYAATQVGLSAEEMRGVLTKLTRSIGDAANGSKSAIDAFNSLGVGVLDASGNVRSTDDVIRDVADALQRIDDPARRASIAVDLFGKAGQKMLPFLEDGAKGIDDLVTQAKSLGLIFDESIIRGADEASDKLATLSKVLGTQMTAALVELAPILTAAADGILRIAKETRLWFEMFKGDEFKSLDALDEKLQGLLDERDRLNQQQKDVGGTFLDGLFGADDARKKKLAEVEADIERVKALIDPLMLVEDKPAGSGGSGNPPPTSTGKSEAEKQAETLSKKIIDLQVQVDTFDLSAADAKIAEVISGIDQSLPGAKEAVITISSLIRQFAGLTAARDQDKASVAEYDKIVADADAAWQKRLADGKAMMEAVRTPLETYQATVETLNTALAVGTINQETYNRSVEAAQDVFRKASEGTDTFRQYSEDAMGTLWSGLIDAAFAADNLQEALRGVLIQLAKMAASKAFSAILDKGLDALFDAFSPTASAIPIGPTYRGHATGGPAGGRVLVGERGPELIDLPAGSFVNTAKASAPMLDQRIAGSAIGAGGMTVVNNINIEGSGGTPEQNTDLANKVQDRINRAVRAAVDERIGDQQRSGGILNPGMGF